MANWVLKTTSRTCRGSSRAGFTLLEMLLALAILGTLLAVCLPQGQRSFQRLALRDAAFTLASNLRYAQAMAVSQNQSVRAVFDEVSGAYRVETERSPGAWEPLLLGFAPSVFRLPDGVSFRGIEILAEDGVTMARWLAFGPDGRGGLATIEVIGSEGAFAVTVTRQLGRIAVDDIGTETEHGTVHAR